MPLVLNRRMFLQTALASAALAQPAARARWALLSDIHIPADPEDQFRGFHPAANLAQVTPQVVEYNPRGALVNGDLARVTGAPGDYSRAKTLLDPLSSRMPLALALGNHDNRANFFPVFGAGASPVHDRQVAVVDAAPMRFIVLDSLLATNVVPGFLGKEQRAWLEQFLGSSDATPTIVFVHHPPDDADSDLLDSERLLRLVVPSRKVKAVIFGHTHTYRYDSLEGLHLINIPAVGYNFADAEPVGWVAAELGRDGADFTLHAIGGNKALDGKTRSLAWRS